MSNSAWPLTFFSGAAGVCGAADNATAAKMAIAAAPPTSRKYLCILGLLAMLNDLDESGPRGTYTVLRVLGEYTRTALYCATARAPLTSFTAIGPVRVAHSTARYFFFFLVTG